MFLNLASGLMATAVRRGLLGGSRPWFVVMVLLASWRMVRRFGGWSKRAVLMSERLEVGDRLEVSKLPPREPVVTHGFGPMELKARTEQ